MRTLHLVFIAFSLLFALVSCDNVTEEIQLKADGSGQYKVYSDAIPSMRMMITEMSKAMMDLDSIGADSIPSEAQIEEELWKDFPEDIDSLIAITENLPDSIKAELDSLPHLKKVEGFMEGGRNKGYVNTGMKFNFDNLDEMDRILTDMERQRKKSGDQPIFDEFSMEESFEYGYKDDIFSRIYHPMPEGETMPAEELDEIRAFFGEASFITRVRFDKYITDVAGDHMISLSAHEVVFKYDLLKMMNGEQDLSFEISLK